MKVILEEVIVQAFQADKLCPSDVGILLKITTRQAREWLHARGVASYRPLPSEMEEESRKNMKKLAQFIPHKKN